MRRRALIAAAVVVPVSLGLAAAVAVRPGDAALAVDVFLLFLGGLAVIVLARATAGAAPPQGRSALDHAPRTRPARPQRLRELARLEREVDLATQSAFDVYYRLRPTLREIAAQRLARHGVDLDAPGGRAEQLLGAEAWAVVRPDLSRPAHHLGPGIPLSRARAVVEALERL